MKQVPVKLGPLALLLAVISICLTTLAILTFTTARGDLSLARKYAATVQERYALEAEGQAFLQELAEDAPMALMDAERDAQGVRHITLEHGDARLRIAVAPDGSGGYAVTSWRQDRQWTEDTSIGNLWAGF